MSDANLVVKVTADTSSFAPGLAKELRRIAEVLDPIAPHPSDPAFTFYEANERCATAEKESALLKQRINRALRICDQWDNATSREVRAVLEAAL